MTEPVDPREVAAWFRVSFDDQEAVLEVDRPEGGVWRRSFAWSSVIRVCLKVEPEMSDGVYVFTKERPESYVFPVEASGGAQLFDELMARGLFGAEVAIRAASALEGLFCWPPDGIDLPDQNQTRCQPPESDGTTDFDVQELAEHLRTKFPDRESLSTQYVAELRDEMAGGGLKTLAALDAILEATPEAVARFEADQLAKGRSPLANVGVVRVALRIFDSRFLRAAEWHFMTEQGLAASDAEQYAGYRPFVKR
jgi:hypothetical protein